MVARWYSPGLLLYWPCRGSIFCSLALSITLQNFDLQYSISTMCSNRLIIKSIFTPNFFVEL